VRLAAGVPVIELSNERVEVRIANELAHDIP
jgi:hypothetical protein